MPTSHSASATTISGQALETEWITVAGMASRWSARDRIVRVRAIGLEIATVIAAGIVRARVTVRGAIVLVPEAIEASVRTLPTVAKAAVTAPRRPIAALGPLRASGVGVTVPSATFRRARQPACNQRAVRQALVDGAVALRAAAALLAGEAAEAEVSMAAEVVGVAAAVAGVPILR